MGNKVSNKVGNKSSAEQERDIYLNDSQLLVLFFSMKDLLR